MRRSWKLASGGLFAAAGLGAYLYWIHDWRPSCSNVPSAAAAAEWLNGLASVGDPFTPAFVACAEIATFYEGQRGRGRDQYPHPGIGIHYATPPRPEDFAKLKDLPRLHRLTFLASKAEAGYADALAASLARYKVLKAIEWKSGEGFTDAGLRHLAGLTTLEELELSKTSFGGDGVAELAKLPLLTEITLWDGKIRASGLAHFADFHAVRRLRFYFTEIEGSLAPIARMPALQRLSIHSTDLDEAQVASLASAPALRFLDISKSKTATGRASFEGIAKIPKLEGFALSGSPIEGGLEALAKAPALASLTLVENGLDDRTAAALGSLRQLRGLSLDGNQVGDPTLEVLAALPRLESLSLSSTAVTDAGLDRIARMPKLAKIWLDGSKASPAGIAKLKAARSDLTVVY